MGALITSEIDALVSHLRTAPGILRSIRRESRQEIRKRQAMRKALSHYIEAIRKADIAKVSDALLAHGYVVLLADEQKLLFDEFHKVIQEYNKLLDTLRTLTREFDRVELDPSTKASLGKSINTTIDLIEQAMKQLIGNIAGIQSFSMSSFTQKLLERESQIQSEGGEVTKAIPIVRDYTKVAKAAEKALRAVESHVDSMSAAQLANVFDIPVSAPGQPAQDSRATRNAKYNLASHLKDVTKELGAITTYIINLLNESHNDLMQIKEGGTRVPLSQMSEAHPPSFGLLQAPHAEGGYGYPTNAVGQRIASAIAHIEAEYLAELKKALEESRIIISYGERMKVRA